MKIKEIKELLEQDNIDISVLEELKQDNRIGVKKLIDSYYKKLEKKSFLKKEYEKRTEYENKCYNKGYKYICGVDEVGRGPLAGPVVCASVILKKDSYFEGLMDSKKLSKEKRESLFKQITKEAISYSVYAINNEGIDKYNIYEATKIAMYSAIKKLEVKPDYVLIDAMPLEKLDIPNESIIKGDDKSISIAAASVIAKVYRDDLMIKYAKKYPGYDFENNMGYGTKKHIEAIYKIGITHIHRKEFEPIKTIIKGEKTSGK